MQAGTATSTDVDGDIPQYTLAGTDSGLFNIDANSGALTFNAAPDFETPANASADNRYQLQVTATDGSGGSVTRALEIVVANQNEAPLISNSSFESNDGFGGPIGSLAFSDPDAGDVVQMSIVGGSGQQQFGIDPDTGVITQTQGTTAGVYTLNVQAIDAQGATTSATLTISISLAAFAPPPVEDAPSGPTIVFTGPTTQPDEVTVESAEESASSEESIEELSAAEVGLDDPSDMFASGQANAVETNSETSVPDRLPAAGLQGYGLQLELRLDEVDEAAEQSPRGIIGANFDVFRMSSELSPDLLRALNDMREETDRMYEDADEALSLTVQAGTVATLSLTAGFVAWLLRTGSLLASVLSSSPLWRQFDPIPVLAPDDDDEEEEEEEEDEKDEEAGRLEDGE